MSTVGTKLYVGNLPDNAREQSLRDIFQAFGDVSEVAILRGYGFVVSPPPSLSSKLKAASYTCSIFQSHKMLKQLSMPWTEATLTTLDSKYR